VRVIAGSARGRRLIAPHRSRRRGHSLVRPTSDLVRGAIFSAFSRGADWCDFVEQDRATCETIRQNLRVTGFEDQARVYAISAARALSELSGPYAVVLADPPYEDKAALRVLEALSGKGLAQPGKTVLVLEHSSRTETSSEIGGLALINRRRHGDSAVSIYR